MDTTKITAGEVRTDDYLIISNDYRPRFAIKVETIGPDHKYVIGKCFSIATLKREGLVAFSGNRTKLASLRPSTLIVRVSV